MYACFKRKIDEEQNSYRLIPIREQDMESIRLWRNAQMDVLRQNAPISAAEQKAYFKELIFPSFAHTQPNQILFSFLHANQCIGYGGLTHIDWNAARAEISFLLDPQRLEKNIYKADFHHFLKLLIVIAFNDLKLHRLFTETFAFRVEHIAILESMSFKKEGILRDHIKKQGQWIDSLIHGLLAHEV